MNTLAPQPNEGAVIDWRNIAITLKMPATRVLNVMAFHEKGGRSQVGSFLFSLDKFFLSAESPLLPFFLRTLDETCATVRPQWLKPDFVGLGGTSEVPFPLWTDSGGHPSSSFAGLRGSAVSPGLGSHFPGHPRLTSGLNYAAGGCWSMGESLCGCR
jgi:hypothetical protein